MIDRMVPVVQVSSAEKSLEFYVGKLGFTESWRYSDETSNRLFIAVERDGVRLFLSEFAADDLGSPFGIMLYFYVKDVDALAKQVAARGVDLEWAPRETFYGTRECQVRDPDGNKLRFGARLS